MKVIALKKLLILSSVTFIYASLAQQAVDAVNSENPLNLDTIIVTATKTAAAIEDIPQAVSLLDSKGLSQIQPATISEALQWMPGVAVGSVNPYLAQPTIRGLGRGRVVFDFPTSDF